MNRPGLLTGKRRQKYRAFCVLEIDQEILVFSAYIIRIKSAKIGLKSFLIGSQNIKKLLNQVYVKASESG